MGRTVPSLCMLLEGIIEELPAFRRALRGKDRNAFDSLMNMAIHESYEHKPENSVYIEEKKFSECSNE